MVLKMHPYLFQFLSKRCFRLCKNLGIQYDFDQWGKRMLMLQVASKILDSKEFAKFLDISEKRLNEFVMKNKYPNGEELLKIKTRFSKTNFDWLLFGHIE